MIDPCAAHKTTGSCSYRPRSGLRAAARWDTRTLRPSRKGTRMTAYWADAAVMLQPPRAAETMPSPSARSPLSVLPPRPALPRSWAPSVRQRVKAKRSTPSTLALQSGEAEQPSPATRQLRRCGQEPQAAAISPATKPSWRPPGVGWRHREFRHPCEAVWKSGPRMPGGRDTVC